MKDILFVYHPCSGRRPRSVLAQAVERQLLAGGRRLRVLATEPGIEGARLLSREIESQPTDLVVVAGGDGTVRDVAERVVEQPPARRPALLLVATGTANNAARSIDGAAAASPRETPEQRLARTLEHGSVASVDVGRANGRVFVGSLAVAMDADILAWRNAVAARLPQRLRGYPLYLASCAVNAMRRHGGRLRMELDDDDRVVVVAQTAVNLLVTNTALYAGEFRFASGRRHDDGRFDLLWNPTMRDYLRRYAAAWPRHLRVGRGLDAPSDAGLRSARRIVMQWSRPMAWQLDGEEMPAASRIEADLLPAALRVLVAG